MCENRVKSGGNPVGENRTFETTRVCEPPPPQNGHFAAGQTICRMFGAKNEGRRVVHAGQNDAVARRTPRDSEFETTQRFGPPRRNGLSRGSASASA